MGRARRRSGGGADEGGDAAVTVPALAGVASSGSEPMDVGTAVARRRWRHLGPYWRLVGRRLLLAVPVLIGVSFLSFVVMNALPGDAAQELLGMSATPAQVHQLEVKLHLNLPFWTRYGNWLYAVVHGHLGTSLQSGQPVSQILGQRLPVSLELVVCAFVVSLVIAVPVALIAARRPDGLFDRLTMLLSMLGLAVAPYVLALLLVLVLAVDLGWLPAEGFVSLADSVGGNIRSMVLPALSLGLGMAAFYVRILRADVLEQMDSEDYVTTARAKGMSTWRVVVVHAFRNALFPIITVIALNFGRLLEGTVIVETIFSIPGIGQELVTSIQVKDVPVVEGIVLVMAGIVVVSNLLTDVLYSVLDPRIRYGRASA